MQHSSRHQLSHDTALELADTLAARRLYPPEPAGVRDDWADERELPLNLVGGTPDPVLIRVVERFGLPQRLLVAPSAGEEDGAYRLLQDARWLAAAREAGLRRLPVRVLDLEPAAADLLTLILNQQQPANVAAQVDALEPLLDAGLSEEEIGRAAGMKKAQVARLAKLRGLDPVLRGALSDGAITPATAQAAADLPELQPELTEDFEREGRLTPAQVRRRAEEAARAAAARPAEDAEGRDALDGADPAGAAVSDVAGDLAPDAEDLNGIGAGPGSEALERLRAEARALLRELDRVELPAELAARLAAVLDDIGRVPEMAGAPS